MAIKINATHEYARRKGFGYEAAMHQRIAAANPRHFGFHFVRKPLDVLSIAGMRADQAHECLVFEPLREPLTMYRGRTSDRCGISPASWRSQTLGSRSRATSRAAALWARRVSIARPRSYSVENTGTRPTCGAWASWYGSTLRSRSFSLTNSRYGICLREGICSIPSVEATSRTTIKSTSRT